VKALKLVAAMVKNSSSRPIPRPARKNSTVLAEERRRNSSPMASMASR